MKILMMFLFVMLAAVCRSQSTPAEQLADKIAIKMKDTLGLSTEQKNQLYEVNLQIHATKMLKRQQYAGSDSLRQQVQWVENTRDSLYRPVLTTQQYELYLQKKRNLVNNN